MKFFKSMLAAMLLSLPLWADETPVIPAEVGHVTLTWQKFNDLWNDMKSMEKRIDTLTNPENQPPIPFTMTKAVYQGDMQADRVLLNAIFEIDVYEPKAWVKVPFLPSSVAIEDAKLDGNSVGILEENDFHEVLLRQPGRHTLRVRYALKTPRDEDAPELILATPNTAMTILAMRFPKPHLAATIEPSQGVETETSGQTTLVTASIPPTSQINIHWQKAPPPEAEGPAKLYVDTQVLFTISEAEAQGHWNFNYTILHRGTHEILIAVPTEWNILSVDCDGLQEWKLRTTEAGNVLAIQLAYAYKGNLVVSVAADHTIKENENVLTMPPLTPMNVEREQGVIGLEAHGTLELQTQETTGLIAIDPQELPRPLWNEATQPVLFAFRYSKTVPFVIALKRQEEVPVLTTTIDDAHAVTLLTERGQMITHIEYNVRNNLKQFLAVQLPPHAQLWSAFVSGQPVKPTQLENGAYRIPLAKSQLEMQGQQGFPVELVYFTPISRFWPIGFQSLSFPLPDVPVSQLLWSLYFPEKYRAIHFGGDLETSDSSPVLAGMLRHGDVETFDKDMDVAVMRKKTVNAFEGSSLAASDYNAAPEPAVAKQVDMVVGLAANLKEPTRAGVFPVSFEIPTKGQLFNFSQVMVVDKNPVLGIYYLHAWMLRLLLGGFLVGLGVAMWRAKQRLTQGMQILMTRFQI